LKIKIEDDPQETLKKLFELYIKQMQEEINFANAISNEFVRKNKEMRGKGVYSFKWLYEYALSINSNYTKTKVKEIVKRILEYYKEQNEAWQRDHSIKGKRLVYVMPEWDYLYREYLEIKDLLE
jgi:hypothetical protein